MLRGDAHKRRVIVAEYISPYCPQYKQQHSRTQHMQLVKSLICPQMERSFTGRSLKLSAPARLPMTERECSAFLGK
jgi:hypothetical protein